LQVPGLWVGQASFPERAHQVIKFSDGKKFGQYEQRRGCAPAAGAAVTGLLLLATLLLLLHRLTTLTTRLEWVAAWLKLK
jgi:hypothetical protein